MGQAFTAVYGNPTLSKSRYDADTGVWYLQLGASGISDFARTLVLPMPAAKAQAQQHAVRNASVAVVMRVTEEGTLLWQQPQVRLANAAKLHQASFTDDDYTPSALHTQIAAADAAIPRVPTIDPVQPVEVRIDDDSDIASLQAEVLREKRQQAAAKAKAIKEQQLQAELKSLRQHKQRFNDDLPPLLAKLPPAAIDPNLFVLAIGITDYRQTADVPFADRSATLFAQWAQKVLGAKPSNTTLLTNADATSGAFRGRLNTLLARLRPQHRLLVYYAGHGVPTKQGSYLLAQDGGPGSFEEQDLQLNRLYRRIGRSRVANALVFIDACFSGRADRKTMVFDGIAPIIRVPRSVIGANTTVISAGGGKQFANQHKQRGHRLFGYHPAAHPANAQPQPDCRRTISENQNPRAR